MSKTNREVPFHRFGAVVIVSAMWLPRNPDPCLSPRFAVIVVGLCALLLAACSPDTTRPRPHLIVIMVDTLRADHLGYHGYSRETAPNLAALSRESTRFLQHTANASRTGPSVATLFTGLHPQSHGVVNPLTEFDAKGTLAEDQTTLAEILSQNGYRCGGIVANTNVTSRFGFDQGFESFEVLRWKSASEITQAALDWLDERSGSSDESDPPFCLYLHYIDPHSAYAAPAKYVNRFVDPHYEGKFSGSHRQLDLVVAGRMEISDSDLSHLQDLYDAEIAYVDDQLGILFASLRERGLLNDSVILFLSDHGEEWMEHDSLLHGYTLYEEQLRVPLLIRDPRIEPLSVGSLSRQIDVLPTILELLAIPVPATIQGESLVPLMRGAEEDKPRPVFAEASLRAIREVQLRSYSNEGWKLIENLPPKPSFELYHLAEDPGEEVDLSEKAPLMTARMLDEMNQFREQLTTGRSETVKLDRNEIAELRALGYMPETPKETALTEEDATREIQETDSQMWDELHTLGYLEGSNPAPEETDVTIHRPEATAPGLNFMVSGHGPEAILFDMDGTVLHRWSKTYQEAFPGSTKTTWYRAERYWRRAHLYENGDVLAIFDGLGLIKVDKDSKLLWATHKNNHHDLFVAQSGGIFTLAGIAKVIPQIHESNLVLEDFIVVLAPNGKEMTRISLYEAVLHSEYSDWLKFARDKGDFFHTNTIEVLDGTLAHLSPHYRKGNVLVSIHGLDAIGIVDMQSKRLVWGMRGPFKLQHQPTMLENGNILIFDNLGGPKNFSRVLEIEPHGGKIVWSYQADDPGAFYSFCCGSSQRLENGNTLITDTAGGKAFEVTRDKDVVWQFQSPYRTGEKNELVASLFEVVRLRPHFPSDWASASERVPD